MNKLTKIGASALCGSLAGIASASAGDLTVSGGADLSWVSQEKAVVGQPIGLGSNYTFSGSGELENGWDVKLNIQIANGNAYSNSNVTIGLPGLGDIRIDQGVSATGIQRLDDITPNVWEEADGGITAGINKIMGTSAGGTIEITPSDAMPDGLTARFAFSKDADSAVNAADKGVGGASGTLGSGWDLTLEATGDLHGVDGLTLYGGISEVEQFVNSAAINGDKSEDVLGIKYAMGGFTAGYQQTNEDTGVTATTSYENTSYGITFSVNDDLSVGYNHTESSSSLANDPSAESFQVAYTMGGASIRLMEQDVKNQTYGSATTADFDATIISLGLAF